MNPWLRLRDEHAILAADNGAAFAQSQFNNAGVQLVFLCPGDRIGRRFDRGEIDDAAFRLGNDFVFDDENVAGFECKLCVVAATQQFI